MTRRASIAVLIALLMAAPFAATAQLATDPAELTPAQVRRQLTDRGFDVRSITRHMEIYKVEVATIDGSRTVFMGVDPRTGRLLPHAFINPAPEQQAEVGKKM